MRIDGLNPALTPQPKAADEAGKSVETYFLKQFLKESRLVESMGLGNGPAAGVYEDVLHDEFAKVLAESGALELSGVVSPSRLQQAYHSGAPGLTNLPVSGGRITSEFGHREDPFGDGHRLHRGIDIAASKGTDVQGAAAGRVRFAGKMGGYGNVVILEHAGGLETRYAHLESIDVEVDQAVASGDRVGRVGDTGRATGPHLHFELRRNGHAEDPTPYLSGLNGGRVWTRNR